MNSPIVTGYVRCIPTIESARTYAGSASVNPTTPLPATPRRVSVPASAKSEVSPDTTSTSSSAALATTICSALSAAAGSRVLSDVTATPAAAQLSAAASAAASPIAQPAHWLDSTHRQPGPKRLPRNPRSVS